MGTVVLQNVMTRDIVRVTSVPEGASIAGVPAFMVPNGHYVAIEVAPKPSVLKPVYECESKATIAGHEVTQVRFGREWFVPVKELLKIREELEATNKLTDYQVDCLKDALGLLRDLNKWTKSGDDFDGEISALEVLVDDEDDD